MGEQKSRKCCIFNSELAHVNAGTRRAVSRGEVREWLGCCAGFRWMQRAGMGSSPSIYNHKASRLEQAPKDSMDHSTILGAFHPYRTSGTSVAGCGEWSTRVVMVHNDGDSWRCSARSITSRDRVVSDARRIQRAPIPMDGRRFKHYINTFAKELRWRDTARIEACWKTGSRP